MCDKCCRCMESDEKAYKDLEALIEQSTPECAWALYFVSEGVVRENITKVVTSLIAQGNKGLESEFPGLAPKSGQQQGGRE